MIHASTNPQSRDMKPAKELRKDIGQVGFDFWVRNLPGVTWVAPNYGTQERCETLIRRLTELGYSPVMNGKRGTSGEWIVEIH
jgi:hypothetical protein